MKKNDEDLSDYIGFIQVSAAKAVKDLFDMKLSFMDNGQLVINIDNLEPFIGDEIYNMKDLLDEYLCLLADDPRHQFNQGMDKGLFNYDLNFLNAFGQLTFDQVTIKNLRKIGILK